MIYRKLCPDNLSTKDRQFLKNIKSNPEIKVKKADKGSAVVIMNTSDYLREGYRQLNDHNFYQKLDHDPTKSIAIKINKIIQEMVDRDLITPKMASYLICDDPKPG
jgi:glycerophosphoryl diester phosphodiesterase